MGAGPREETETVHLENERRTEAMMEGAQRAADLAAQVAAARKLVADIERLVGCRPGSYL